jgi:hypothetical protein
MRAQFNGERGRRGEHGDNGSTGNYDGHGDYSVIDRG